MQYLSLFGYLLEILITLFTVLACFHFYHKYSLKFYLTFAYCVICGNVFSILNFLGYYLTESIFSDQPVNMSVKAKIAVILNFISLPFLLLCLFFIMVLFRELFNKTLTPGLKRASLIAGLILLVSAVFIYIDLFSGDLSDAGRRINFILEILITLTLAFCISQGFFYLKKITNRHHRRVLLIFTLLFLGMFVVLSINIKLISGLLSDIAVLLPWELLLLIFMVKKMNEFYLLPPNLIESSGSLEKVYRMFHITEREREIIALICRGKTNRNIEDSLFISLQTVKNNIYNIFKKLKVKNRVELVNFIRLHASDTSA